MAAMRRRGFGQRLEGIGFFIQPLPMKIARLDEIAVDQREASDSGARQSRGVKTAQRSATDDRHVRRQKRFLSRFADAWEKDLARIPFSRGRVHDADGSRVARLQSRQVPLVTGRGGEIPSRR